MRALVEIYRRYFTPHVGGLFLTGLLYLVLAAEGSIMAAMSRYLIDEVLQVDLAGKVVTHAQPECFVSLTDPSPAVLSRPIACVDDLLDAGPLPGEDLAEPILTADLPADGSLQDRIAARTGRPTGEKLKLLAVIAVALALLHLGAIGASTWSSIKMGKIAEQVVFVMRRHIHDKLLRLQLSFHDQHQTGRLLSRAIDDVQVVESNFASVLTQFIQFIGLIAINISIMFYISPKLAGLSLLAMPFYAVAYNRLCRRIRDLSRSYRSENAALYGLVRDRLANPKVVKSFGQERRELTEFFRRARGLFRRHRRIVVHNNLLGMICTAISATVTALTLGYGVILLQRGELSLGYLLFFYTVCYGLFYPIASLSQLTATVQWLRVACERVLEVLNEPITIAERPRARRLTGVTDGVTFNNVTFTFDGAEKPAVDAVTLRIPKGAQTCLMGKSGAGKSTLGMLLLRLYDPDAGSIAIDNVDLRNVRMASLRTCISFVPQEPILFSGTLAGNITYGNPRATREQMIAAAGAAEIHDFIETLPDGYDTVIGENGLRLSGGQKQRISLARALINDPDILVLDDCTSALDAETEAKIQKTFKTALAGRTVLLISHRVSAAANSDTVVVLDDGRIAEQGTHEELLDARGTYWNLIRDQLEEQSNVALTRKRLAGAAA